MVTFLLAVIVLILLFGSNFVMDLIGWLLSGALVLIGLGVLMIFIVAMVA